MLPILFGKGCYFNQCKFCDIPFINHVARKSYLIRSPERVAADVIDLNRRFGCRHFEFTDEALVPRLLVELADSGFNRTTIVGSGLSGTPVCQRLSTGARSVREKLARMGMQKLFFGLESGAEETLDHSERNPDLPTCRRVEELPGCRGPILHVSHRRFSGRSPRKVRARREQFFRDNTAIIDHPANSFDIHPFGLELRTRYADEANELGVHIDPDAMAKEFVIGVGDRWVNTRGLTQERARDLLNEFQAELHRTYRSYHATEQPLWPGFEEYTILYADRYDVEGGAFPFRTSLPGPGDPRPYRLGWSPAAVVEPQAEGRLRVSSRFGFVELDSGMYELFSGRTFLPLQEMLAHLAGGRAEDPRTRLLVRQTIDELIGKALLQIQPAPAR